MNAVMIEPKNAQNTQQLTLKNLTHKTLNQVKSKQTKPSSTNYLIPAFKNASNPKLIDSQK
jgi:hypothetical protein